MKYCSKCGKELLDEAVVCPGCGCSMDNKSNLQNSVSTFKRNRKQWIIAFSVLFVVFALITTMILTSDGFDDAIDMYQYRTSSFGTLGVNLGSESLQEWEREVKNEKTKIIWYCVASGVCGIFAVTFLTGDIILIVLKKKEKGET